MADLSSATLHKGKGGAAVPASELWSNSPVLVVVLRRPGCRELSLHFDAGSSGSAGAASVWRRAAPPPPPSADAAAASSHTSHTPPAFSAAINPLPQPAVLCREEAIKVWNDRQKFEVRGGGGRAGQA